MPIELTFKTSARLALAISAAFPLSGYAASAGKIDFAMGPVTSLSSDGRSRPLTKGSDVNTGETINTGNGRAQLRYTDGSQVSIQPGTQYRIDDYRFNGKNDGEEKAFFNLIKGSFRTITGLIGKANKEAYKVTTPVATIGIRGTEFVVKADENGVTVSTGEGLVQVCTAGGCIILASGESAIVIDKDGKPVRIINTVSTSTSEKPATPSVIIDKPKDPAITATGLTGYAFAGAAVNLSNGQLGVGGHASGTATFSGSSLAKYVSASGSTNTATIFGAGNGDNTIYWGSWASSTFADSAGTGNDVNLHYVTGLATTSAELSALSGSVNYSFLGATDLSIYNGSVTTRSSAPTSGTLNVNFTSNIVEFFLYNAGGSTPTGFPFGFTISGSGTRTGATFSGTASASGATGSFQGILVGANAARAGLTYGIDVPSSTRVTGAAVFTR